MLTNKVLEIAGYRNEPVPHKYLQWEEKTRHVAIVLPGMGYTADMPVLYYPSRLLLDAGADLLVVEYAYNRRADFTALPAPEREQWLFADVSAACRAALAQRPYQRVTLLGKSLGTLAMARLLAAEPSLAGARTVWLTPLLNDDRVWAQLRRGGRPAVVAIGTADRFYDATRIAGVRETPEAEVVIVDGADHSLELAGDVLGSLAAMERVLRAVRRLAI